MIKSRTEKWIRKITVSWIPVEEGNEEGKRKRREENEDEAKMKRKRRWK